MANDLTKLPKEVVIDLINTDNGTSLTSALVSLGVPIVATGGLNTSVTVTAAPGSGYKGSQTVTYNRLALQADIADKFLAQTATPPRDLIFQIGDAKKISDIIPELNTRLNINLTVDDFIDGDLPAFAGTVNESHDVQVVAHQDSLCYTSSLTFTLKAEEIELSSVITTTALNGLVYTPPAVPGA